MTGEKRYVPLHEGFVVGAGPQVIFDDPHEAQEAWGKDYRIFELGPEWKPDYGPLVAWVRENGPWLRAWKRNDLALTDALKAAGIE